MKPFVEPFGDDVVKLRLLEVRDLDAILSWRNRDDARIWFKTSETITLDRHREWYDQYVQKDDDLVFIVEASGDAVGMCSIYDVDRTTDTAEIGRFLVAPEFSGQGYMKRACTVLLTLAQTTLGLRYIFLDVMENNRRALAVYLACGFKERVRREGLIRMSFGDERNQ
jgi:diamine N-acetyltransferase